MNEAIYINEAGRHDIYRAIHRGLRNGHTKVLNRLALTDFTDPVEVDRALTQLRWFLDLAQAHLDSEESKIHPAVASRDPDAIIEAHEGHDAHESAFAELESLARAIEDASGQRRLVLGEHLYRRYARFFADDLLHMEGEETGLLSALHRLFDDADLAGFEGSIVAALPFPRLTGYLGLIVSALCPRERRDMLLGMQAGMPSEAFLAIMSDGVRPALDPIDWALLADELGVRLAA